MKWLTRQWARGEMPADQAADAELTLRSALEDLNNNAPAPVISLATGDSDELNLSDAHSLALTSNAANQQATLSLGIGNQTAGYRVLDLLFGNARVSADPSDVSSWLTHESEVWYWEVERAPAAYELRLLVWPRGELAITFESLRHQSVRTAERPIREPVFSFQ
jgi:hypothetical protein